jgi:hypothetical protein
MNYYKNDATAGIAITPHTLGAGWTLMTQNEIDAYLLSQAKIAKVEELKVKLEEFQDAGTQYTGDIVCPVWAAGTTYSQHDLVLATDSKNYQSLADSNLGNDPVSSPGDWEEFTPVFRVNDEVMLNLGVKGRMNTGATNRYKYYSIEEADGFRHFIDFDNNPNWSAFAEFLSDEKDRVMVKYNGYRTQIALCATIAAVDAIVIDFSA